MTFKVKKYLLLSLIVSTVISCSSQSILSTNHQSSSLHFLQGPLPKEATFLLAKNNLTRVQKVENLGEVEATLLTPPLLYLRSLERQELKQKTKLESIKQLNLEIDHLVRYHTCFALTVKTIFPAALEWNYWTAYALYQEDQMMPIEIKATDEDVQGAVFRRPVDDTHYQGHATLCTTDQLDVTETITLVLNSRYRPGTSPLRLTWAQARQ